MAGCVPVAIALGGQPEIVEHGDSGFLWQTLEELGERTLQLAEDRGLCERMGRRAQASARRRFGREAFATRLDRLLEEKR